MKPFETLYNLINSIYCWSSEYTRRFPNPGQLILRQNNENRESLKLLKSADIKNPRLDDPYIKYGNDDYENKKEISNLKIEFDKKINEKH